MAEDKNGINAMMEHKARVANDNNYVRGMVERYIFAVLGTVKKYADERVDAQCGVYTFTNIEVMVFGVDGWGIKPVPAVGDRVLVVSTVNPTPDLKTMAASASMPAYDASGFKAICLTDSGKATQLITVDKDKIEITGNNKLTVNADGIQFEDVNGNKVTTSSDGVSFEDTNGNKVDTTSDGVAFEDKNGNKVTTDSNGIATEDKNGNKYTGSNSGTVIDAKGGCKIEMGSTVKINGKLEILNS